MTSHPDADQFMRLYLRNPTDVTTRLVFADWLEETGVPSNVAWAHFVRARAAAEVQPANSSERSEWEREADRFAPHILADLTIPAALFVGYPKSLLQLLPAANITVKLAGFRPRQPALDLMPESVAREILVMGLDRQDPLFLIAAANPWDRYTLRRLAFILNRDIIAVRAGSEDIRDAIDDAYAEVVSELAHLIEVFSDPGYHEAGPRTVLEGVGIDAPVNQLVGLILVEARQRGAQRVLISPISGVGMRFRVDGDWSHRELLPDRVLFPIATRLARMAGAEEQFANTGRARGTVPCAIDGNHFNVRLAIEPLEEGPVIQLDLVEEPATIEL